MDEEYFRSTGSTTDWCCLNVQLLIQKLPPLPLVWVCCSWIDTDCPVEDAKAQSIFFCLFVSSCTPINRTKIDGPNKKLAGSPPPTLECTARHIQVIFTQHKVNLLRHVCRQTLQQKFQCKIHIKATKWKLQFMRAFMTFTVCSMPSWAAA